MRLFTIVLFFCFLILINPVQAEWLSLQSDVSAAAEFSVVNSDLEGTILRVELPGVEISNVSSNGEVYASITLPKSAHKSQPGAPEVPMLSTWVAIPATANVELYVRPGKYQTLTNTNVLPYSDDPTSENRNIESIIYDTDIFFPQNLVEIANPEIFRDVRYVPLQLFPVQVNPLRKEVRIYAEVEIELRTSGTNGVNSKTISSAPSATYERFYRKQIINYEQIKPFLFSSLRTAPSELQFLIISPDNLAAALYEFVSWKNSKGIRTYVASLSETGSTNLEIKAYIQQLYDNPDTRPEYILFVGLANQNYVPAWTTTGYLSDNPYCYLEGEDETLDVVSGRFPCRTRFQLLTMVNRTLEYEQTPVNDGSDWFKRATMITYQPSSQPTKRYISQLLRDNDYIEIDEHYDYGLGGVVIQDLNGDGRAFVNYRGTLDDYGLFPSLVDPNGKFPFLTWITCSLCDYAYEDFCVNWLIDGSSDNPEGAIGVIGGSQATSPEPYARRRDSLDEGIYEAFFEQQIWAMGDGLLWGKQNVVLDYPMPDVYSRDTYNHFALMGDPTCQVRTDRPQEIEAEYQPVILLGSSIFPLHLEDGDQNPISGATVAITNQENETFFTGFSDENGDVSMEIAILEIDQYDLVITAPNFLPHISTLEGTGVGMAFEGYVTDSETGSPLDAQVFYDSNYTIVADAESGFYRLLLASPGEYTLHGNKWGYYSYESERLTIAEEETLRVDIELEPYPNSTIRGYVRNFEREPIANAIVTAIQEIVPPPVVTDVDGHYEITCPGSYTYEVRVVPPNSDQYQSSTNSIAVPISETVDLDFRLAAIQSFEVDEGGFEFSPPDTVIWEYGVPTAEGGPAEGAYHGENVWGTVLADTYPLLQTSYLITPPYYLFDNSNNDYHLMFYHWYEMYSEFAGGNVQISTDEGETWTVIHPIGDYPDQSVAWLQEPGYTGNSNEWLQAQFDLSDYLGQWVQFRFHFSSWVLQAYRGWFIDYFVVYGTTDETASIDKGSNMIAATPTKVTLQQNYPNPFNPQTSISYSLAQETAVNLSVYDISGRLITTIVNKNQPAGTYTILWKGKDAKGQSVSSGVYLYTLKTDDATLRQRMLLLK